VLIVGSFTLYYGVARNRIVRINSDGSLDETFDPGIGADNTVNCVAIQRDGKIIIGGAFTNYNGTVSSYLARLKADGSYDLGLMYQVVLIMKLTVYLFNQIIEL
jgi:hypothetical protein